MARGRRGQVQVRQQADGRWRTDLRLGPDPATGRPVRVTIRRESADEVWAEVVRLQAEQRRGAPVAPARETLAAYLDRWLEEQVRTRRRPSTYARYERAVRHHITPFLGHLRLDKVTADDVDSLLYTLALEGRLPRHERERARGMPPGLSPASLTLVRAVLRRALGHAVRRRRLGRNAAADADPPAAAGGREPRPLTDDQARRLLAAARGTALDGVVTIALGLGLRQGEALGLTWPDLDLDAGVVRVRRQLQRVDGRWALTDLKSKGGRRDLPLPAFVAAAVERHRERGELARRVAGQRWKGAPWPLVFPTGLGTPWSPRNLTRSYHALLVAADLPPRTWHDLRHSAGSILHALGVDLATIRAILGHSSIAVTADIYTHVGAATKRAAAAAMDTALAEEGGRRAGSR